MKDAAVTTSTTTTTTSTNWMQHTHSSLLGELVVYFGAFLNGVLNVLHCGIAASFQELLAHSVGGSGAGTNCLCAAMFEC